MNKLKLFTENFLIYGLGSLLTKFVPLLMLPLITRLVPNTSYIGISDLSNTIVQFGSAFAVMGMYDAVFRLFFEKDEKKYKKSVCSTALFFTLINSIIVFFIMIIFRKQLSILIFNDNKYFYIVYICAISVLVGSTNNILMIPTRAQNKRFIYLILNFISSILSYSVSIPLILSGYYIIALPLSQLISSIFIEVVFFIINHKWFDLKLFNIKYLKELLRIGIPLLPNFLIYWIFNSCDKVMITNILGTSFSGIYAVGSKISSISQLIYTAFAGGWSYFAFYTMKEKNQIQTNSLIFEYLGIVSLIAEMFMCAISFSLFKIMFSAEYIDGYLVSVYLFLSPLLQMLFQIACSQFLIIKKSWPNMVFLAFGAMINIIINSFAIPVIGIEGAAISTLVAYSISVLLCVIVLCKKKLMIISKKFIYSVIIFFIYFIIWRLFISKYLVISLFFAMLSTSIIIFLYRNDLLNMLSKIKSN